jgi:hypothetical protein
MDANVCKNFEKGPIYSGVLQDKAMPTRAYQQQCCNNSQQGWENCWWYQVKENTGKCPPDLLPNAFKTADEIIRELAL